MKNTSSYLSSNKKKRILKDSPRDYNTSRTKLKKKRLCLKCGKKFQSKGPYNRLCEKCILINERVAAGIYSVSSSSPDESSYFEDKLYEYN